MICSHCQVGVMVACWLYFCWSTDWWFCKVIIVLTIIKFRLALILFSNFISTSLLLAWPVYSCRWAYWLGTFYNFSFFLSSCFLLRPTLLICPKVFYTPTQVKVKSIYKNRIVRLLLQRLFYKPCFYYAFSYTFQNAAKSTTYPFP